MSKGELDSTRPRPHSAGAPRRRERIKATRVSSSCSRKVIGFMRKYSLQCWRKVGNSAAFPSNVGGSPIFGSLYGAGGGTGTAVLESGGSGVGTGKGVLERSPSRAARRSRRSRFSSRRAAKASASVMTMWSGWRFG